jgi:hypothetical protein
VLRDTFSGAHAARPAPYSERVEMTDLLRGASEWGTVPRGAASMRCALLKRHDLVDEVDGSSDRGPDINVDVTRSSEITSGIIGVPVKGGKPGVPASYALEAERAQFIGVR